MTHKSQKPPLIITEDEKNILREILESKTEPERRSERAEIMLAFSEGRTVAEITRQLNTNRMKVERVVVKSLELGALKALDYQPTHGYREKLPPKFKNWVHTQACLKPKDIGYDRNFWTKALLAEHIGKNCAQAGFPQFSGITENAVKFILGRNKIRKPEAKYFLNCHTPKEPKKIAQILYIYKEIIIFEKENAKTPSLLATLSTDGKIRNQPLPGTVLPAGSKFISHKKNQDDYQRLGAVYLLAGLDLLAGKIHAQVEEHRRGLKFFNLLNLINKKYPEEIKIQIIIDESSKKAAADACAYIKNHARRFEFLDTPSHGSWLNLIESIFEKLLINMLQEMHVKSREELKEGLEEYLSRTNNTPLHFRWKSDLNSNLVVSFSS